MKKLKHGQLLDAKLIMDGPMAILQELKDSSLDEIEIHNLLIEFEHELAHCDVSDRYEEIK